MPQNSWMPFEVPPQSTVQPPCPRTPVETALLESVSRLQLMPAPPSCTKRPSIETGSTTARTAPAEQTGLFQAQWIAYRSQNPTSRKTSNLQKNLLPLLLPCVALLGRMRLEHPKVL